MKQLTIKSINAMIDTMQSGELMLIPYNLEQSKDLFQGIDVNIIPIDDESFKIQKPNKKGKSKFAQIMEILESYKRGSLVIPFEIAYVRQVVSRYNAKHPVGRFNVTTDGDDVYVSKHIKHWLEVTQTEFDTYKDEVLESLMVLESKILCDDEEYLQPQGRSTQIDLTDGNIKLETIYVHDEEIDENQMVVDFDDDEIL